MEMDSEPRDDYQWWRISFSAEDGKTRQAEKKQPHGNTGATQSGEVVGYAIRKVSEIEVLRAAREEWGSVLLVYASENAMNAQVDPAPPQLQVRPKPFLFRNID
jgi:predicted dinucleotide-binding enzyme